MITSTAASRSLLIVDDECAQLQTLSDIMRDEGFQVCACATFEEALEQSLHQLFSVAILDLRLVNQDGIELLASIQRAQPSVRAIIHTAHGSFDSAKDAVNIGAFAYVEKRGDPLDLVTQVHRAAKDFLSTALTRSEQHFVELLNDVGAIVWECDLPNWRFTFVSQQAEAILGYAVSQWLEEDDFWVAHIHPDDRDWCVQLCIDSTRRGEDHEFEYRAIAADGRTVWLNDVVHVVKDESGTPIRRRGVMTEITARKNAEEALKRSELRYRSLVENAPICIHEVELDGRLSSINPAGMRMVRAEDQSAVVGQEYMSFVEESDRERIKSLMESAYQGEASSFEFAWRAQGQVRHFASSFTPIRTEDGSVIKLLGTTEDVTEQRNAEATLRASEERFRQLAENINAVFWMRTGDGREQIYVSPMYEQIWGRSLRSLQADPASFVDAVVAEDRPRVEEALLKLMDHGRAEDYNVEYRIQKPDGQVRWIHDRGFSIYDEQRNVIRQAGLAEDVTEARRALEQVRIRGRAIAAANIGIVITDARKEDLPIVYCNPAFEQLTGYAKHEVVGKNCRLLQAGDKNQEGVLALRRAVATERECTAVVRNYRKCGRMFWNEVTISPVEDRRGRVTHFVGFQKDITLRVESDWRLRESEDRFRTIFEQAAVGVALIDTKNGRFVKVNQKYSEMIGHSVEEMTQLTFMEITHADDLQADLEKMRELHAGKISEFSTEKRLMRKDGSPLWVNLTVSPTWHLDAEQRFHIAIVEDITAQKRAESALQQSEAKFRALVENSFDVICMFSAVGECLYVSPAVTRILGYQPDELVGRVGPAIVHPDDVEEAARFFAKALDKPGQAAQFVHRLAHKDGSYRTVEVVGMNLLEEPGVYAMVSIFRDVTERKRIEEQLRLTQLAVDQSHAAFFRISSAGQFIYVNASACQSLGYSEDELLAATLWDIDPEWTRDHWEAGWERVKSAGASTFESTHRRKDGTTFPVSVDATYFNFGDTEFVFAFATDITARKMAEVALKESEEKFRVLTEQSPAIVFIARSERVIYCNPALAAVTGYSQEELLQTPFLKMIHPEYRLVVADRHRRRMKGEDVPARYEIKIMTKDRQDRWLDLSAQLIEFEGAPAVLGTCVNVTDRTLAEERLRDRELQLAHVSRLSTMGEMVAGIAHEVNQPLYSIVNFAKASSNLLAKPRQHLELREMVKWNDEIARAASRAGDIIKRMRNFIGQHSVRLKPVAINEVVRDSLELLDHQSTRCDVLLRSNLPTKSPVVRADAVQLQQVMVNLLFNAIEAIDQAGATQRDVDVTVTVRGADVDVAISDTGPGLTKDAAVTIFDAFVSTKPKGMGMGLTISTTIVESFGGRLRLLDNERGGATFEFTLPLEKSAGRDV